MGLGGEIHNHLGVPALESVGNGRLVGDVSLCERIARVVCYLGEIQMAAGVSEFVNYDQPPILFFEGNTREVGTNESCAARDDYSLHVTPKSCTFFLSLVAP